MFRPTPNLYFHPECKPDEIYLGNKPNNADRSYLNGLKTLRYGNVAYDIFGDVLPDCTAMFIHRSEQKEYDRIMIARIEAINRGQLK